jgi:leucyl-tRNA synthetase
MVVSKKIIEEIREEVKYWNNVDFRYTAWGHMSNHLNFLIYHYSVIFPKSMWPKKICVGQFMNRNGEKISKSKGNGTPLYRVKELFGADLFRLYNGISSNFDIEMDFKDADVFLLKKKFDRFSQICLSSSKVEKKNEADLEEIDKWFISKFYSNVNLYFENMEKFKIREAYVEIFYETLKDLNYLTRRSNEKNTQKVLRIILKDFLILMTPIIPHICEEIYENIKQNETDFISKQVFETKYKNKIDNYYLEKENIVNELVKKITTQIEKNNLTPKTIKIFQAKENKFELFDEIKNQLEINKKNIKLIFENLNKKFPSENKFIKKFLPKCLKFGISFYLEKEKEKEFLETIKPFLENEFNCKIEFKEDENSIPSNFKIEIE